MPRSMIADVVSVAARAAAIRRHSDRSKFCGPCAPACTRHAGLSKSGRSRRSTLQLLVGHPLQTETPSRRLLYPYKSACRQIGGDPADQAEDRPAASTAELDWAAQRAQVCPQTYAPAKHFMNSGGNIGAHADPANACARRSVPDRSCHHPFAREGRESLPPRGRPEGRPCPKTLD